jgi:hypothetical protein
MGWCRVVVRFVRNDCQKLRSVLLADTNAVQSKETSGYIVFFTSPVCSTSPLPFAQSFTPATQHNTRCSHPSQPRPLLPPTPHLRSPRTNKATVQLSLLASLKSIMPDIGTKYSVNSHIVGAAGAEFNTKPPSPADDKIHSETYESTPITHTTMT